jgi:hypothetical protein
MSRKSGETLGRAPLAQGRFCRKERDKGWGTRS